MMAKTGGAVMFGVLNAFVPIVVSAFLGLFISVAVHEVFEAQTFSNFFRFPMLFLCGLFIPIGNLPVFLRPLSYLLPLTYGADILKEAINQEGILPLWVSFPVLLLFAVGLFVFSLYNIRRKWVL